MMKILCDQAADMASKIAIDVAQYECAIREEACRLRA